MALSDLQDHKTKCVAQYFEILKMRHPLLYLLKPDYEQTLLRPEQKASVKIQSSSGTKKVQPRLIDNAKQREKKRKRIMEENFRVFEKKFPG